MSRNPDARALAGELYVQFWERRHKVYAAFVVPQAAPSLAPAPAPTLEAVDLYPEARSSQPYEVTWRQVAAFLGISPPWFDPSLRHRATISAWKPGDLAAIIPADDIELPTRPLTELAADEPDGSPAAAACLWLARQLRREAAESARRSIEEIRAAAADPGSDCACVNIAAVPAPLLRLEDDMPAEMVLRAGWAQIVERRDTLAAAASAAVLRWDSGKSWPVGQTAEFDPASCPAAAEWTSQLSPAPAGQPPTVLERRLLECVSEIDHGELLHDETTGCAAVRRTDHLGTITVLACVPQRISTVAPLAEVTLSGRTVWIRTSDGRLWLAPSLPGRGLSWGYGGSGPYALAALLGWLLDDITGPPIAYEEPPPGLHSLIRTTPQEGTTTYSRAQLLAARAG